MRYAVLGIGLLGVASAALFARYGLQQGATAEQLSAWRLIVASAALLAFRGIVRARQPLPSRHVWLAAIAGIFLAAHFATWIASLSYISVARSTLLVCTAPVWAGITGLFIPRLRPRPIFWAGLVLAGLGTWLITSQTPPVAGLRSPEWAGDLLAVAGAICIVPYLLISQDLQKETDTLTVVTWIYSFAAAALWFVLAAEGKPAPPAGWDVWLALLGMAVFAQLVGHSSLNWSLGHFSAAQVATSTLLEPVFAGALAWVLLGERLGWIQALGAAVLLSGVAINLRGPQAPPVSADEL